MHSTRQVRRLGALGAHVASGIESEAAEPDEASRRRAAEAEWAERRAQEASSAETDPGGSSRP